MCLYRLCEFEPEDLVSSRKLFVPRTRCNFLGQ
jgi:hypothetical protein